jgi:hypothetical protein
VPTWVGIAAGGVTAVLVIAVAFARPAVEPTIPWRIVAKLNTLPAPKHVVADFLVSGVITGEVPSASVAMDTRMDNYSPAYAQRYLDMLKMGAGWRHTFAQANPDYAVLISDTGLPSYLQSVRHWTVVDREYGFVLLRRPG